MADIIFIVNAGDVKEIGSGHIYRCINIAKQIIKKKKIINIK